MFEEQMGFIRDEVLLPAMFNDTKIAPTCKKLNALLQVCAI